MDSQTRQEYIRAAVSFLQDAKLIDSTLQDKLKFLRDKGLNELEVDEALNLALVNRHQPHHGKWNFLLILGLCVGGYKLYTSYMAALETKREEEKRVESEKEEERKVEKKQLSIIQNTINDLTYKHDELKKSIELQRSNISTDIQSLKTLLLGHEKFAAPPIIPAWQLKDSEPTDSTDNK